MIRAPGLRRKKKWENMNFQEIFSRHVLDSKISGAELRGQCPFHDDTRASFSANIESGLWLCHACGAKGNSRQFAEKTGARIENQKLGLTLAEYSESKKLPIDFLRSLGLSETHVGFPQVRIPYRNPAGEEVSVRFRIGLTGNDRFRWSRGSKVFLYGLWRLNPKPAAVVLVEGESDCHTLWFHNLAVVGIPGANNWNEARDAIHLNGIATIYVCVFWSKMITLTDST